MQTNKQHNARSISASHVSSKKVIALSTPQIIALGFLLAILVGSILLCLPISSASGEMTPYFDALFMSATSICVTGIVLVDTFSYWSLFGKIIILLLIQIGSLGIVSLTTSIILILGKRVTLKGRLLLQEALNLDTLSGLVQFLLRVLKGTFIIEGIGTFCYAFVFVPEFGIVEGLWISLFTSVSAFCNAGFDIIGASSLMPYATNLWVNIVTTTLIIIGGLGFIVWWDIIDVLKLIRSGDTRITQFFKKLHLHSKIVLLTSLILTVGGTILILLLEYHNPATIGQYSFGNKVLVSFFQSVTLRTAGFATISQKNLMDSTAFVSILLMFIGGSPVSTAGGIKTTTIALVCIATISSLRSRENAVIFKRTLSTKLLQKALSITVVSTLLLFIAIIIITITNDRSFMDIAFETTAAICTTGLSRSLTPSLNMIGKVVIMLCMYYGRVGPISLAVATNIKKEQKHIGYPTENVTVG